MAGCVRVLISRTGSPCHTLLCKFRTVKYKIQRRDLSLTSSRHSYDDAFRESIKRPEEFWGAAAEALTWHKKWNKVLDNSNAPLTKWLVVSHCLHLVLQCSLDKITMEFNCFKVVSFQFLLLLCVGERG